MTARCADCGENDREPGNGLLCHGCYARHQRNGSLDGWARLASLPAMRAHDIAWQVDALCSETDPEAFFPEKGGSTRQAKAVCAACPVAAECLDYALATGQRFGIWGGVSERKRRALGGLADDVDDDDAEGVAA